MGIALADSAAEYGAVVDLVLGPVNISPSEKTSQILAGFALETGNGLENAKSKLIRKNLDLIVLNSLGDAGAGFGHDTNMITIIDRDNNINKFELKSKKEAAMDILNKIILMIS
jgi:phosphopantothenoylcysteine decarboxylase/phosphopantothenate--cysteine ligase